MPDAALREACNGISLSQDTIRRAQCGAVTVVTAAVYGDNRAYRGNYPPLRTGLLDSVLIRQQVEQRRAGKHCQKKKPVDPVEVVCYRDLAL